MSGIFSYEVPRTRGYLPNHRGGDDLPNRPSYRDDRYGRYDRDYFHAPFGGYRRFPDMYNQWIRCVIGGDCGQRATTLALGEEDGGNLPPRMTTYAVGEEDGGLHPIGSTRALGEEDGGNMPPRYHTMAVGIGED